MSKINARITIKQTKKTIDISNETLTETFSIFHITNDQLNYFLFKLKLNFFQP